jgi:hypothetical protein
MAAPHHTASSGSIASPYSNPASKKARNPGLRDSNLTVVSPVLASSTMGMACGLRRGRTGGMANCGFPASAPWMRGAKPGHLARLSIATSCAKPTVGSCRSSSRASRIGNVKTVKRGSIGLSRRLRPWLMVQECDDFANDRPQNSEQEALRIERRQLSHALRGKRSRRALKAREALAKRHRKVAHRRKNHGHGLIATEELSIGNMTASARGTVDRPGKNVKQKAGLNRAILDTAPGSFVNVLCVKAEEAGCQVILLDTRRYRPSQTWPSCARVRKKALSEPGHHCVADSRQREIKPPHFRCSSMAQLLGREPAWAARLETPSRDA